MRYIKLNVFLDRDHKSSRIIQCILPVKRNTLLAFKTHTCSVGVIFLTASFWEHWFQARETRKNLLKGAISLSISPSHSPQNAVKSHTLVVLAPYFQSCSWTCIEFSSELRGSKEGKTQISELKRNNFSLYLFTSTFSLKKMSFFIRYLFKKSENEKKSASRDKIKVNKNGHHNVHYFIITIKRFSVKL